MRISPARRLPAAVAVAAAVTGTLTWTPAASAQSAEPTHSAFTALTETPAPDAGSVAIIKKDPAGGLLAGASFLLMDATGHEAGRGKTDAQGKLTFPDLAPGVYRLKETGSGSPLHDLVADQDVIVTPGATARLTIVDPFKPAQVLLKAKDDKTGKLLPGSTVNIGSGKETLLTLTTGPKGTATGELPVTSRKTEFWVKQVKAPEGYDLYKPSKTFTAGPGAPVTVTVTNAKTATTPKPTPTEKPTEQPTGTPSTPTDQPTHDASGESQPAPTATGTPDADSSLAPSADATDTASPKTPEGSLAHTGTDANPWILGGAGLLLAAGTGAVVAARRRTTSEPEQDDEKTN
ncbi:SpaA isopeptide-forming pilin-related protein [Streptomyces sp. A3M-1-3]|uniref:MSCRAMM family protein n=1 Tax=Streptomyces sp. A3M-1-3 TaxID=2962044 RepID=UPI0020B7C27F|nr:SpaA isopeptide-forming pilin-related protein [Streptomyces sp. A3M-1-3]MCP3821428.1 SpaA isopeptide-forming pilin-related protein [Streptomyces sp. A3M-1-3]